MQFEDAGEDAKPCDDCKMGVQTVVNRWICGKQETAKMFRQIDEEFKNMDKDFENNQKDKWQQKLPQNYTETA